MAERTTPDVLGAALVGGAVGATIALLLAPRSGKETRERIKHSANDLRNEADTKLSAAKAKAREGLEGARDFKDRVTEAAKDTGKKLKDEATQSEQALSAWEEEV